MDLAHMVHAGIVRAVRSPALHFVLIGVALFAWSAEQGVPEELTRLQISRSEIEAARADFRRAHGRPSSPEEERDFTEALVDQEILYHHALRLKLHEQPVVRRRLAQIASFVAANPHEPTTEAEKAEAAIDLGLHHGDLIVRRILIDGARRLIRAPWLLRLPDDETLQSYLKANRELFEIPPETRISQIAVNRLKHGGQSEERARAIAEMLRTGAHPPEEAAVLGDELLVARSLPPLSEQDLERKLGHRFVRAVSQLPTGSWSEPVPSIYGLHVVYIHERIPARLPSLEDVRDDVRRRFLQEAADRWLDLRLAQLRSDYEIVLPGDVS